MRIRRFEGRLIAPGVREMWTIKLLGPEGKRIKFQPAPPKKGEDGGAASPATR